MDGCQAHCYSCGHRLEPEFAGEFAQADAAHQYDTALVVRLEGGYGMFIDPLGGERAPDLSKGELETRDQLAVVICHDCAHAACEALPWLQRLINPFSSHSHKVGPYYGDHKGWDLPHHCPDCQTALDTVFERSSGRHRKQCSVCGWQASETL